VGDGIRRQSEYWLEPWRSVLDAPGARSMAIVRRYFESGGWWALRPANELILDQPGTADVLRFQLAARTGDGRWTAVYTPLGGTVTLAGDAVADRSARWFDPRTGIWQAAAYERHEASGGATFRAPDEDDWILDLRT
jgi:hypothetical protein